MDTPMRVAMSGQMSARATSSLRKCPRPHVSGVLGCGMSNRCGDPRPAPHATSGTSVSLADPAPWDPYDMQQ